MSGRSVDPEARAWQPSDAWLLGIVLAVINFWLFAQTLLNVIPGVQRSLGRRRHPRAGQRTQRRDP